MERREFFKTAIAGTVTLGVGSIAGVALAGTADGGVRITRHEIPFNTLHGKTLWTPGKRLRIAQLTDIHVGWGTSAQTLQTAQAQAKLVRPDLLVLTGDYLNHSLAEVDTLRAWVRGLPRPCVATLGNHDWWSGAHEIAKMLESEGIQVLSNDSLVLPVGGESLRIVGVEDGFTHRDDVGKAFAKVTRPEEALVLSHDPKTADKIAKTGARLVLSGHTHGGQFDLPGMATMLSAVAGIRYLKGWYQVKNGGSAEDSAESAAGMKLYVNAGVGSSVPSGRNGTCGSELAIFDLV